MDTLLILLIYSAAIVLASLAGGLLPWRMSLNHTRMQMIMSLVSGLMLGVAMFHLLPHSIEQIGGDHPVELALRWCVVGLLSIFLLLRLFHFHQPRLYS